MSRRFAAALSASAMTVTALVAAAAPAQALPADKSKVLSGWTQTDAGSYGDWLAARGNQGKWAAYAFDWSTDYCSKSPDNPFGFPFETSCARHDFGYRNYKKAGTFAANKPRLDSALYADLKRVCAKYSGAKKTSCYALAWTYYEAVKNLG
ncbi:phospholipase [Streptomyces chrestomyceticus]|uniref:phospholipase n=1 Tax=Streptomyces chrestomyceticus TaxID=68185 RepID=UPI0037A4A14B